MATAKKKNKTNVHNPPRSKYAKKRGNSTKRKHHKRKAAATHHKRRRRSSARRNPTYAKRRRAPARNPASTIFNQILMAGALAVGLRLLSGALQRVAPTFAGPILIASKVGAGIAAGSSYGRKLLGTWAPWAQGLLFLSAALDAYDVWVAPLANQYLGIGQAVIIAEQPIIQDGQQMGVRYTLSNGNILNGMYDGSGYVN